MEGGTWRGEGGDGEDVAEEGIVEFRAKCGRTRVEGERGGAIDDGDGALWAPHPAPEPGAVWGGGRELVEEEQRARAGRGGVEEEEQKEDEKAGHSGCGQSRVAGVAVHVGRCSLPPCTAPCPPSSASVPPCTPSPPPSPPTSPPSPPSQRQASSPTSARPAPCPPVHT